MRGKMTPKINRRKPVGRKSVSEIWPQFKKNYLKTFEKLFRKTNPGMLEILNVVDKSMANKELKKNSIKKVKGSKKAA